MFIKAKKISMILLGAFIFHTGIIYLIRKFNQKNNKVPILMYHSIGDNKNRCHVMSCLENINMVVQKDIFREQIVFLNKFYSIISLNELVEAISNNKQVKVRDPLVITFDDGFKDNYRNAFPILKQYGIKATIFLVGNVVKKNQMIWQHRLYSLIDSLTENIKSKNVTNINNNKNKILKKSRKFFNTLNPQKIIEALNSIEKDFNYKPNVNEYYLNTNDIKEMYNYGIEFGSHTMNHFDMTSIESVSAENEIKESILLLKELTGNEAIPFAYPRGFKGTYNYKTVDLLKKYKISCGLTTIEGLSDQTTNIYEMNRIEIREFGIYELILHVSGIIGSFKKHIKKILHKD